MTTRDRARALGSTPVVASATFALSFVWFLGLSLSRWNAGGATSFDLGIFSQSAQSWARGELPHSDIRQLDLIGDHFSPITVVFGVAWKIWPDPRSLLILQALCLAAAVAIVAGCARRRLPQGWMVGVVVAFALSARGLLAADLFDVHEVALGAPIIAVLAIAVLEERFALAVGSAIALATVKEDMGLTIAAAGVAWWCLHRRSSGAIRRAAILIGLGMLAVAVAYVVIKSVNGQSEYTHFFTTVDGLNVWERVQPLLLFLITGGLIAWRSPIALLAAATLAWRMGSSFLNYWSTNYHYDLLPGIIALIAGIDAMHRLRSSRSVPQYRLLTGGLVSVALVVSTVFAAQTISHHPGGTAYLFRQAPHLGDISALTQTVPPGASIAAGNDIGPYIVAGHQTFELSVRLRSTVDYVMFSTSGRWVNRFPACTQRIVLGEAEAQGWTVVRRGSIVLVATHRSDVITRAYRTCGITRIDA